MSQPSQEQEVFGNGSFQGGSGCSNHRLGVIAAKRAKKAMLAKVAKPTDAVGRVKPMGVELVPLVQLDLYGNRVE